MDHYDELKFVYLLERPTVALHLGPRGDGPTKYLYNLPADYLKPFEVQAMIELRKLIPSSTTIVEVPVYRTKIPYDLTPIKKAVPKNIVFSDLNQDHVEASLELTKILLSQGSNVDFFNASALCRDSVNTHLWIHAFTRAVLQRPQTRGMRLPAIWEVMPDFFIEGKVWQRAILESILPQSDRAIIVIDKNFSGTNLDPNHKVAYFGEDVGINAHHWHWHMTNPSLAPKGSVDRKGEIFYYMHHAVLARYDAERLANGLNRVVPFNFHHYLLEEACFAKLSIQNSSTNFSDRQENTPIREFQQPIDANVSPRVTSELLQNLRSWCDRIIEAIDAGFAILDGGGRIDLRTDKGIEIVTAMWESSNDSPNKNYYGIPHNFGHTAIGFAHDPGFRYKAPPGVMYFTGTSMRDPAFFRWHKYLDLISKRQKDYLPPYTQENLLWPGIIVNDIQVVRVEPSHVSNPTMDRVNNLITHWMQSDIELSRGMDFGRTNINGLGSIWVRATHLQHVPFIYKIRVTNQTRAEAHATVRIFMAPKFNENNDPMPFYDQRDQFFEMDKFTTILHPGENIIIQKSEDSTLTIPWSQTFREVERDVSPLSRAQAICGCGWPDHLLLPRGRPEGMMFDVFVMLSNTQIDQVQGSKRQLGSLTAKGTCRDSISFCGMIDDKVPDARPMGWPFDRPAVPDERSQPKLFLADFVKRAPNMGTSEVNIFHVDKTILRDNGAPDNAREVKVVP